MNNWTLRAIQAFFLQTHASSALRGIPLVAVLLLLSACLSEKQSKGTEKDLLQGVGYGINHSSLLVDSLDSTRKHFSEVLGFSITEPNRMGKSSFDGRKRVQLLFPDLSSIEFVSREEVSDGEDAFSFIRDFFSKQEGIGTYSISSSSVSDTYEWLVSKGFDMDSVQDFPPMTDMPTTWKTEGMFAESRSLAFAPTHSAPYYPQFIEYRNFDYGRMQRDWKTALAMGRAFSRHPNGVVGTLALQMVVADLSTARKAFRQMGLVEVEENEQKNLVRFQLKGTQELHLSVPQSPNDSLADFLQQNGPGVFGILLEVNHLETTQKFLAERLPAEALHMDSTTHRLLLSSTYAQGVQFTFQQESEAQSIMAEKLKMGPKLDSAARLNAASMYKQYCALCHGENREGYAADFAPSLRSHSLMATSKTNNFLRYTVQYGRAETAMAGYLKDQGGPLDYIEIELLLQWLYEESGTEAPIELSREPVVGDVDLGSSIFSTSCAVCHGEKGEGISAPALGKPMLARNRNG